MATFRFIIILVVLLYLDQSKKLKKTLISAALLRNILCQNTSASHTLDQFQTQAHVTHRHKESPSGTCYGGERSESLMPSDVMVYLLDRPRTATPKNAPAAAKRGRQGKRTAFGFLHLCVRSLTSDVTLRRTQTECVAWTVS